jgi:hypothetical protein
MDINRQNPHDTTSNTAYPDSYVVMLRYKAIYFIYMLTDAQHEIYKDFRRNAYAFQLFAYLSSNGRLVTATEKERQALDTFEKFKSNSKNP